MNPSAAMARNHCPRRFTRPCSRNQTRREPKPNRGIKTASRVPIHHPPPPCHFTSPKYSSPPASSGPSPSSPNAITPPPASSILSPSPPYSPSAGSIGKPRIPSSSPATPMAPSGSYSPPCPCFSCCLPCSKAAGATGQPSPSASPALSACTC